MRILCACCVVIAAALCAANLLSERHTSAAEPQRQPSYVPLVSRARAEPGDQPAPVAQTEPIQLAWFYKPPGDGDLRPVTNYFSDADILTKGDERTRDDLRRQGVAAPILQYIRFEAIQDPGSCISQPWRNQVADRPGGLLRN